ncbi:MAG TPA: hypothetical protein VG186_15705 [Solirubrobacteraceae bacterium]|jgi:hypothetical protein|nr:hypothetical protein [Solirubrobacteraceae bacterium]
MVIFFTSVAGLIMWIIMWAFGIKSVVAISGSLLFVGIAVGIQRMLAALTGSSE